MRIRDRVILLSGLIAAAGALLADRTLLLAVETALASGPVATSRLLMAAVVMAAVFSLALLALLRIERIRAPIDRITLATERVASGSHLEPIETEDPDLGRLGSAVDRMRGTLVEQINRAETDRRLLASMLSGLHEGILVVSNDRRIMMINEALKSSLGIVRWIPEGARLIDAVWDHTMLDAFDLCLTERTEVRRQIRSRGERSFQLTVTPFSDASGKHAGAIGLLFDMTRLEALERVRREFVADISHELRTPLASIKAAVETLQAGAKDRPEDARRFLEILFKNCGRMEAILSDLTDLSMIETGAISLSFSRVDLASSIREVMEALALKASRRSLSVRMEVPDGIVLDADRRRFEQIFINLVDNAIKFSPPGATITIAARVHDNEVTVEVADTGPGIPPDALDRVFNRFYQVNRARDRQIPGTGLGLAIVKHLTQRHGGQIAAANREEGGAVFTLRFPLARAETPSPRFSSSKT